MVVLSTSKEIENLKHPRKSKNPKFQFSKIPIFQNSNFPKKTKETKKNKKNNSAQTMGGRGGEAKSWHNCVFCFFWFLWFFLKIGILENWNFGKLEFWKLPLGEGGG